jgi:hypothetical protein
MTEQKPNDRQDDPFDAIEAAEERTVVRLHAERPIPAPAFRGELRRRLDSGSRAAARTSFGRFSARALAVSYLGAGLILLGVAAAGLAGAGPFGA